MPRETGHNLIRAIDRLGEKIANFTLADLLAWANAHQPDMQGASGNLSSSMGDALDQLLRRCRTHFGDHAEVEELTMKLNRGILRRTIGTPEIDALFNK